jgi:hypothetical protein
MQVLNAANDRAYFIRRSREERERATICDDISVALVHLAMAEEYDRRAAASSPRLIRAAES